MAPPNKHSSATGWEPVDEPQGWEPVGTEQSSAAPDFSVKLDGMESQGLFRMMGPSGKQIPVPYGRVMEAAKAGYRLDPEDRITYARNREFELRKAGKKLDLTQDVPEAFATVSAAPARGTPAWFKQRALELRDKSFNLLPTAFGIGGGLASGIPGAAAGPADIAVAGAGATAGGILGETIRQHAREKFYPYEPKMTPKQAAMGIVEQGGLQGINEVTGRVGGRLLTPALKYFGDTADLSAKTGIPLLPSEAAGKAPSYMEKFLKGSVLTQGKMEQFRTMQNAQTQKEVQKIADGISQFHGTSEDLGNLVQDGIDLHTEEFRATQKALYDAIGRDVGEHTVRVPVHTKVPMVNATGQPLLDAAGKPIMKTVTTYKNELVDKVMPSTVELKRFAAQELEKLNQEEQILDPALLSASRSMLENILKAPDNVTFNAMKAARSDALAKARELDRALAGKEAGLAKKMSSLFDDSMMKSAKKSGISGLPEAIEDANRYTANEHRMFEQELVKKIVETKKPEAIATLIRGRMVGGQELRDLFTVMPKPLHAQVQRQILVDTMRQSTNLTSKVFNERRFADAISGIGDERGRIIFGKNWDNVRELSKLLEKVNGPTGLGGGTGASLQNLSMIKEILAAAVAAPVGLAASGHLEAGAITIAGEVVGFKTLATLMTNPALTARLIKAIQTGLRIAPYAASGAYAATAGGKKKSVKQLREEAASKFNKVQDKLNVLPRTPPPSVEPVATAPPND